MGGPDRGRQVAAGDLVLALGPGLDPRQATCNGEFDGLIIAELEMQEGHLFQRAPLATVQGVAPDQVQGSGDRHAVAEGHDQGDVIGHGRPDAAEEVAGQIGPAPFA